MAGLPSTPVFDNLSTTSSSQIYANQSSSGLSTHVTTPLSAASSNNTFLMPNSPRKGLRPTGDGYKPKVLRTGGQRPACLVNASVTYCGNDSLYAFGGFDQYSDEVYNHVLKLDLSTQEWSLVDNYGDIPGVRMGHTATFYQGDKLLIYGGENEHRNYLSDVIIFDFKTAHWTQPTIHGPVPRGRARHAAVLHEDRLFIVGGLTGNSNHVLDDICYLDLKTWTWSRTWRFVGRFDHTAWIWGNRMWVFGGLGEDMERGGELFWLDLKDSPAFSTSKSSPTSRHLCNGGRSPSRRVGHSQQPPQLSTGSTGYAANSSSIQVNPASIGPISLPVAPGSISSLKFISGGNLPPQTSGTHFHIYSSGSLLDFVTPAATIRNADCSLSALELDTLSWQKVAEGPEIFTEGYRWHYCAMNEDCTKAWLLGCASGTHNEDAGEWEDYLSDVLAIDLRKFGLLGNSLATEPRESRMPASDRHTTSSLSALGADLATMFDQQGSESVCDFVVTANGDGPVSPEEDCDPLNSTTKSSWVAQISPPIHVHKLVLQARWPHFCRLWNSQMAEFHTKKMHIPEPYTVVRAFLYYLYTDSIARHHDNCPDLSDVAGMLVMANLYDMPRLRLLCLNRLGKELDVDNAAVIWERASTAQEAWLGRRASRFIQTHWGYVSRTPGFKALSRSSLLELCMSTDPDGRLVGGEELEVVGGLGGSRFGVGGIGIEGKSRSGSSTTIAEDADADVDVDESEHSDEDMEIT